MVPDVDETPLPDEPAVDHVERLAVAKCEAVRSRLDPESDPNQPTVVIAADTIVHLDGQILGKPMTRAHAAADLRRLSGRSHDVVTGVAVAVNETVRSTVERTRVRFAELTEAEIAWYVATGEPDDKAGSYAMQGRGGVFVTSIDGSYDNVIGLPRHRLGLLLRDLGQSPHD